jgi:hypothetical protein
MDSYKRKEVVGDSFIMCGIVLLPFPLRVFAMDSANAIV